MDDRGKLRVVLDDTPTVVKLGSEPPSGTSVYWYDGLVNKYGCTLHKLDTARVASAAALRTHLIQLGYE